MSPVTAKIKGRDSSVSLRYRRPRLPKKRDRLDVKEVLVRDAIEAEIKEVLATGFKRPRLSNTRNRP